MKKYLVPTLSLIIMHLLNVASSNGVAKGYSERPDDYNYKVRAKAVRIRNITFENPLISFSTGKGAADRRNEIIGNGLLD